MEANQGVTDDEQRLLRDIAGRMGAGDFARASELAETALARGLNHPLAYQARALRLDELGKYNDALANFLAARSLSPNDPLIANGIAISLARLGRLKEAMAVFEVSLALERSLATTHFHKGWVLEMHEDFVAARDSYQRAVALAPEHAAAWAGLAACAESSHDWKEAKYAATRALAINPRQPRMIASLTAAEIQEGSFAAAETRLRTALDAPGLVPGHLRIAMFGLLADALDGQNKTEEAFAFYSAENQERRASYVPSLPALDLAAVVRDLIRYFARIDRAHWPVPSDAGNEAVKEHVFLMGFQRSGTTLLEQVLSAHPDVVTLEERDPLDGSAEKFLLDAAGLDRLESLSGNDLLQEREKYWQRVGAHGIDVKGKVFIDKLPLNTIKLPLIAKLFPNAKVLFALRDPRDVVLSCFRRHFKVNASTKEFLTLEGTAQFYNSVMTLGGICREKFSLAFHLHRHEDLVRDFDGEVRRLCAFLGIEWADRFRDFAQIAGQRNIRSMSATQVRRGLNADGSGQWRRYANEMAPVLPVLQPWVEKFGYESV